jgi:hypothetical protein
MCVAKLACLIGGTLFVHGQIVDGTDSENYTQIIGVVPGDEDGKIVEDIRLWIARLNQWAADQVQQWIATPQWEIPPTETTLASWDGRGGARLIAYACPGSPCPTVVYSRYLTKQSMPLSYPKKVTDYLRKNGVQNVLLGHTPHGTAPTVIRTNGVAMIMADTSFSDMKCNAAYSGDNRGSAVFDIAYDGTAWSVSGTTEKLEQSVEYDVHPRNGDPLLGSFVKCKSSSKEFFVKARLKEQEYLLTHIEGFQYEYSVLHEVLARQAVIDKEFDAVTQLGKEEQSLDDSSLGRCTSLIDTLHTFDIIDANHDGEITAGELLAWFCSRHVRQVMRDDFPALDASAFFVDLCRQVEIGKLEPEGLHSCFQRHLRSTPCDVPGVYFPIVSRDNSAYGKSPQLMLGAMPQSLVRTEAISAKNLQIPRYQHKQWSTESQWWQLDIIELTKKYPKILSRVPTQHHVLVSPLCKVSLPQGDKQELGISDDAVYYVWVYPCIKVASVALDEYFAKADPDGDLAFVTIGGFAYLDKDHKLLQTLAAVPSATGKLHFGAAAPLKNQWVEEQIRLNNFHPVVSRHLIKLGAADFCYISPGKSNPNAPACEYGGFAYLGSGDLFRTLTPPSR